MVIVIFLLYTSNILANVPQTPHGDNGVKKDAVVSLPFIRSPLYSMLLCFLFVCSSLGEEISRNNSLKQAQKISKEKLSRRLLEMNEQFDAIEQLTSNMEQDLQRSNRVCTVYSPSPYLDNFHSRNRKQH